MQVLKDSLFYSRTRRPGLDGGAEEERALMAQEQKACRARARKFSLETNRRRKALEEKMRQLDDQEQKQREAVLQQRKQRLQHATEHFLRANIPPSQRSRPASSKRVPILDEALGHIHGSLSPYAQHSPFLSSTSNINRSFSSSSHSQGGASAPRILHGVSAAEAYAKLMQERSLSEFKSSQVLFLNQLQGSEVPLKLSPSPQVDQERHDTPVSHTESLSSLDSLENEDPHQNQGRNSPLSSPNDPQEPLELNESRRPSSPQMDMNISAAPCDNFPPRSFLEEVLNQQDFHSSRSPSPSPREEEESADDDQSLEDLIQAVEQCILMGQSQSFYNNVPHHCQNEQDELNTCANSEHMTSHYDWSTERNNDNSQTPTLANKTSQAFSVPTQEVDLDSRKQGKMMQEKYAKHLSEKGTAMPDGTVSLFQVSSSTAGSLKIVNSVLKPVETESSSGQSKNKSDLDSEPKLEEKCFNIEPSYLPDETSNRLQAEASKSSKNTEEVEQIVAEPSMSSPASNISNVRFLKGILKQSKCVAKDSKYTLIPSHFVFTKQVAISVRDSLELTRAKAEERNHSVKKKLRWFDEVTAIDQDSENRVKKVLSKSAPTKSRITYHAQQPSVDHQQGSCRGPKGITRNFSSDSPAETHSSRQAWNDVGLKEGKQPDPTEEPRIQRIAPRAAGARIPRRVRSARVGPGPVISRARKGTIIRPQSASEARHVARTQGKTMVPRPPPRPDIAEGKTPAVCIANTVYSDERSYNKSGLSSEPVIQNFNPDSEPIRQQHFHKKDEGATFTTVPSSYTYTYETVSKAIYALCQPEAHVSGSRRWVQGGENGICLDRTPTDEEISVLWNGVRSALASKDVGHQNVTHNALLSSSPQASLSHVTINGDSLLRGIKAVRMNGFIISPSSARGSVRGPSVEANTANNRTYVDHSRVQQTAQGERKPHEAQGRAQFQRDGVVVEQQRSRTAGPSAFSQEEWRILQSLNRLNFHLQNAQDMAAGNRVLRGIFDPAYNQSLQAGEGSRATLRRNQTGSADRSSPSHRR